MPSAFSVSSAPEASVISLPTAPTLPFTATTVRGSPSGSLSAPLPLSVSTLPVVTKLLAETSRPWVGGPGGDSLVPMSSTMVVKAPARVCQLSSELKLSWKTIWSPSPLGRTMTRLSISKPASTNSSPSFITPKPISKLPEAVKVNWKVR